MTCLAIICRNSYYKLRCARMEYDYLVDRLIFFVILSTVDRENPNAHQ